MTSHDRRSFLRNAGLLGATGALLGPARPAAAADETLAPFLHGVASGDPLPDGVMLWTRLSGATGPAEVSWRVASDVTMTQVLAVGTATAEPARDWTVKVDVRSLPAHSWLFYDFTETATGRRSLVGRTRTAPAAGADVDRVRLGVVSCSNYPAGYFNVYARLAELDDLDAIVHLGDYFYESAGPAPSNPRAVRPNREIVSLSDYRTRYGHYRLDPDLRRLHQLFPFVTVWDDHESTNNSWAGGAKNHQPATEGDWFARKARAQQAYSEWLPIRTVDPAVIYRTVRFGTLLDLVMLDTRLDGRDEQVGSELMTATDGAAINDPARRLLSDAQRAFLDDALRSAQARGTTWKVLGQQVMVGQLDLGGLPDYQGLGLPVPDLFGIRRGGNALNPDQWDGYPAERQRLFRTIRGYDALAATTPKPLDPRAPANAVQDVVVLTGDIHTAWAIDLAEDPRDPLVYSPATGAGALAVEFVTSSVTSTGLETTFGEATPSAEVGVRVLNPHIKHADLDRRGYLVLDVTPARARADFFVVDTVAVPSTAQSHAAAWEARRGLAGVRPADGAVPRGAPAPATPGGSPDAAPPPVVPEAPAAVMLPLAAVGVAAAGMVALRRRGGAEPAS